MFWDAGGCASIGAGARRAMLLKLLVRRSRKSKCAPPEMFAVEPPQQAAFVAYIAAPAAVQSTKARWLAAVCSTAALRAPKARRRHPIVIFFRFGWLRLSLRSVRRGPCDSPRAPAILLLLLAHLCYVGVRPCVANKKKMQNRKALLLCAGGRPLPASGGIRRTVVGPGDILQL